MCGIVGIISFGKNQFYGPQQKVFKNLLYLDAFRGEDGTGVFGVNKHGNVDMLKSKDPSGIFIYSPEYKKFSDDMMFNYNIVVGHNRKATVGKIEDATAHPFISGNVVMVHNGKLMNHRDHFHTEVDSEALCKYLEKHEDNLLEAISKLDGAFSVVWYNAKTNKLRFWRNKERPMWHAIVGQYLYFSSEFSILHASLSRAGISSTDKDYYELAENQLHELDYSKVSPKWKAYEIPEPPKKELPKSGYYGNYYGAAWADHFLDQDCNDDTAVVELPIIPAKATTTKKKTEEISGADFQETLMKLQVLVGKTTIVRLVDYVRGDPKKPEENYVEGYYSDTVTATCSNAVPAFFEEVENWPHTVKYFRGKVSRIKTSGKGKTFELELEPEISLVHMFMDAKNNWISYDVIEKAGGEDYTFCRVDNCWSYVLKDEWETMKVTHSLDKDGNIVDFHIMCQACLEKEKQSKSKALTVVNNSKETVH